MAGAAAGAPRRADAGRFDLCVDLNEFPLALVLVQDETRALPVGLAFFQGRYTSDIPWLAAGSIIVAGPILIVYILFQRYFIRGMVSGRSKIVISDR